MKKYTLSILSLIVALTVVSCGNKEEKQEEATPDAVEQKLNENYVDTIVLHRTTFSKQMKCNGKLRALAKSELTMPLQGLLKKIQVKNGSLVKKGDLLAAIDKEEAERDLKQAEREQERARVDLIDKLIGLGYDEDLSKVPETLLKRTQITSGYATAEHQLQTARTNLAKCNLYAPFSGRIADMDCKLHQKAEKFCTLIDDAWFDVEFNILEAELNSVCLGQKVTVSPFVDEQKTFDGHINEINPVIDEKGQIKIRAKIRNERNYLIEGMNVRVIVEKEVHNMFVVPKDAVVMRDGYSVVFRYEDGQAVWTYVDVVYSNIKSHAITGNKKKETELHDKDIIIVSGNLNLADGTQVLLRAPEKENQIPE